jgi:hypothetical protein
VTSDSSGVQLSRRGLLIAAAAGPLAVACTTSPPPPQPPDPLADLADQARTDAAMASVIAAAYPAIGAAIVAANRGEHAKRLQAEVDRARPDVSPASAAASSTPPASPTAPPDAQSAVASMTQALAAAQKKATDLLPALPSYRVGLVGSVIAGCASLSEVLS